MIRIRSGIETYINKIHIDPLGKHRKIVNDGDAEVGMLVCVSGQVTRAICGIPVVSMSGTFCDDSGCTPNLGIAEDPLRTIGQLGDSGAPVYKNKPNGRAHIRCMEIAGTAPTNVYFHKISRMEAILGMSVAHSA